MAVLTQTRMERIRISEDLGVAILGTAACFLTGWFVPHGTAHLPAPHYCTSPTEERGP